MSLKWMRRDKSAGKEKNDTFWNYTESKEDLESTFQPGGGLKCIYKHSTTCGICLMAIRQVERVMHQIKEDVEFYYIDVKKDRPVSQEVAEITGIQHESPQILILKEGEVFWHASHHAISEDKLKGVFRELVACSCPQSTARTHD